MIGSGLLTKQVSITQHSSESGKLLALKLGASVGNLIPGIWPIVISVTLK